MTTAGHSTEACAAIVEEASKRGLHIARLVCSPGGSWYAAFKDGTHCLHIGTGQTMAEALRNAVDAPADVQTDLEAV